VSREALTSSISSLVQLEGQISINLGKIKDLRNQVTEIENGNRVAILQTKNNQLLWE
jgi:hypothetical protein